MANLLSQAGSIDTTFKIANGFDSFVNDIAVQNDEKIVAVGYFDNFNDTAAARIIRLNNNGSRDHSFVTGTGFTEQASCIKIDGNGKIYVGGGFYTYNGNAAQRLVRINNDGSIDQNFNTSSGFNDYVNSITFDKNNKVIVAGYFSMYGSDSAKYIARLDQNGVRDTSFKASLNSYALNAIVLANEKIMVLGSFTKVNGKDRKYIALLNSDGTLDESFDAGNTFSIEMKQCIELNGKYLVGGYFGNYALLNANGSVNNTFIKPNGSTNALINTIVQQPNGKILLGGAFSPLGSTASSNFIRITNSGSIDDTLNLGTGFSGEVKKIVALGDTAIYVAGGVTSYNGKDIKRLVRISTKKISGVGILENKNSVISVYPNPTSNFVYLSSNQASRIIVLDVNGKEVLNFNTNSSQIDLSSLTQGIYFLQVLNNEEIKTAKIIKN